MNATPILLVGWRTRVRRLCSTVVGCLVATTFVLGACGAIVAHQRCATAEANGEAQRAEAAAQKRMAEVWAFRAAEMREAAERRYGGP